MPTEANRRGLMPQVYKVLIVPAGEGGKTTSFRANWLSFWLAFCVLCFLIVALTLVALVYTPLARYVSIPNPELEERYGTQIAETQNHLYSLAKDVLILKEYNIRLRRALGERAVGDTSSALRGVALVGGHQVQVTRQAGAEPQQPDAYDVIRRPGGLGEPEIPSFPHEPRVSLVEERQVVFPLLPPTEGFVTQYFDLSRNHFGIDYAGKRGSPVYAPADGYVVFAGWTYEDGNMLIISHGGRYLTVYKHNQSLLKTSHGTVKRGELIALLGTSGNTSLGPHLHFEVWKDGIPRDPGDYLLTSSTIR
jgi:murein DD-endopeptidase MepM/ murein hydrolase activator NlpD